MLPSPWGWGNRHFHELAHVSLEGKLTMSVEYENAHASTGKHQQIYSIWNLFYR